MGSDVVVVGEFPLLPPIKTSLIRDKPGAAAGADAPHAAAEAEDCVTPKGEEHVLKPAVVCPPAPRKPRPAKRAPRELATPSGGFCAVPRDLASVFLALPPKKRICVG